jgi:asparagine synthase (glutamine-hydrolysing)
MCGIAGIHTTARLSEEALAGHAAIMSAPLLHRGPDSGGVWTDGEGGVALGFRRLAIVDLSPLGDQPMVSPGGRFAMVFNGEVYNHRALRADLEREGVRFRGHSDTEVVAAAFERWGVASSVVRFNGMFAIGAWDREERRLYLIRDRMGIKPLYYYRAGGTVGFGSELKALMAGPDFPREIDYEAVTQYLRYLYVPEPRTIFAGVRKLPPGHILSVAPDGASNDRLERYWSLEDVAADGIADPFRGSPEAAVEELEALLKDSVRLRMQADVPVGALLSGGVDSSVVVSLLQELRDEPARTFSVSFTGTEHDEGPIAAEVARRLKSHRHEELTVSGDEALSVVSSLPEWFDEPLANPSQIPTFLICRLARERVTVALSGDGGDELFAGYHRYRHGSTWIRRALAAGPARPLLASGFDLLGRPGLDELAARVAALRPGSSPVRLAGEKLAKLADLFRAGGAREMYRSLLSTRWDGVLGDEAEPLVRDPRGMEMLEWMMLTDQLTYLPGDLLAKVDRTSMATSLEVRVPILDHRIVELSWRMPASYKIRDGRSKWMLRSILESRLPREIIDRPKVGFTVPVADWLRGPLRTWAEELLFDSPGVLGEVLDPADVTAEWNALLSGRTQSANALWAAVVLSQWENRWCSDSASAGGPPSLSAPVATEAQ